MSVFSKGSREAMPRCEHFTLDGERCRLRGVEYLAGKIACVHHRFGGKTRSTKSRPLVIPKEEIFIATYSDGQSIQRKDIPAETRDLAYQTAINRTPSRFKLTNLRKKTEK